MHVVKQNKWISLPLLNVARRRPGSMLLREGRAFCFCGNQGYGNNLNSIESLQTGAHTKWKLLPHDDRIPETSELAGVLLQNSILIFGGVNHSLYLNTDGELLKDRSGQELVPGAMCRGSFVERRGVVFAAGFNEIQEKWK